jgi:hypothetical protein
MEKNPEKQPFPQRVLRMASYALLRRGRTWTDRIPEEKDGRRNASPRPWKQTTIIVNCPPLRRSAFLILNYCGLWNAGRVQFCLKRRNIMTNSLRFLLDGKESQRCEIASTTGLGELSNWLHDGDDRSYLRDLKAYTWVHVMVEPSAFPSLPVYIKKRLVHALSSLALLYRLGNQCLTFITLLL